MPIPSHCPNPACSNHLAPARRWYVRFGSYPTAAHGAVQRYRCRRCGSTASEQTESLHYFAKRRVPLRALWDSLLAGASLREAAGRYGVSPMAVQGALLRLGRQAMAAQLVVLRELSPRSGVVFDGLRSCVTSADYPCELTTVVEPEGETVLTITHSITRRGGRQTAKQKRRTARKYARWRPEAGAVQRDISRVVRELFDYLRPPAGGGEATIDTDEHRLYRSTIERYPPARHLRAAGRLSHLRTSSRLPRTAANRLFAVNYLDRLLRHRLKEHTRESIAIGRHAVMQMHRAWMFAWDHNARRPWRERRPEAGRHAEQGACSAGVVASLRSSFFTRRIRLRATPVPESIRRVWVGELATPPLRWRVGQVGTSVTVPAYARRDLAEAYQQTI